MVSLSTFAAAGFIPFGNSFEKKGMPLGPQKNIIKRLATNHKKNKTLVPTLFWITAHFCPPFCLIKQKKNFLQNLDKCCQPPRFWGPYSEDQIPSSESWKFLKNFAFKTKVSAPLSQRWTNTWKKYTYLSLKFNPLTMGLWTTKLSQCQWHQISIACVCIQGHISRAHV